MMTEEQLLVIEESLTNAIKKNIKDEDSQKLIKILKALSYEEESGGKSNKE